MKSIFSQDGNNLEQVKMAAKRKATDTGQTYFVVYELDHTGAYHACNEFDLDTWYNGISDRNILYCTAD